MCGEHCIGVCNIFAWLGLINTVESSGTFGGILSAMEMVAPVVGGGTGFTDR